MAYLEMLNNNLQYLDHFKTYVNILQYCTWLYKIVHCCIRIHKVVNQCNILYCVVQECTTLITIYICEIMYTVQYLTLFYNIVQYYIVQKWTKMYDALVYNNVYYETFLKLDIKMYISNGQKDTYPRLKVVF